MTASSEDRTEPATPEKLRRARREGQVAKSSDLTGSAALAAGLLVASLVAPRLAERWATWFEALLMMPAGPDAVAAALTQGLQMLGAFAAPVAMAAAFAATATAWVQVGFLFAPKAVAPRLDRVSPKAGARRLFSRDKVVELGKNVLKMAVAAALAARLTSNYLRDLTLLGRARPAGGLEVGLHLIAAYAEQLAILFLVIGLLDLGWSRRAFARQMRMSKREVKREHVESEGDPAQKAARRELAQELLMTGKVADVKKAAVVIVNPVHFAVALAHRPQAGAPRLLAKGRSVGARAIRDEARRTGVPVVENPPLARALHELTVGDEVPEELWDAVADVLALLLASSAPPLGLTPDGA